MPVESRAAVTVGPTVRRPRSGWLANARKLAVVATAVITLATMTVGTMAATASSAVAASPAASPALRGPGANGGCGQLRTVTVRGTGIPAVDKRNLQRAINAAQAEQGCALLIGHFNLGICVLCVQITGPVTVSGQADPTQSPNRPNVTVVSTTGGLGSLVVNEPPNAPNGTVEVRDIWIKGSTEFGLGMQNFYRGKVEYFQNRVTSIRELARFRFGILGTTKILPGFKVLTGSSLVVADNYVDTTALPFLPGDDNGIALLAVDFNTIDYSNNTVITKGESLEIENSVGSSYTIADNTVSTQSAKNSIFSAPVETVGYPRLHGGHPASLKLSGNDVARFSIINNTITDGGGSNTIVCIMQYLSPTSVWAHRTTQISGNRCTTKGIFADLLAGWSGELPFFPQGSLDNATVTNNTFTGTADFGVAMLDFKVPLAPANNLTNTSSNDVFAANYFTGFTPIRGGASLYFGPSTQDNVFVGDAHGPIVNLGKNNTILP